MFALSHPYPPAHFVAEDELELRSSCLHLLSAQITGLFPHTQFKKPVFSFSVLLDYEIWVFLFVCLLWFWFSCVVLLSTLQKHILGNVVWGSLDFMVSVLLIIDC